MPSSAADFSVGDSVTITDFDANANPLRRVDGRGLVTTYAYDDPESRLTALTAPGFAAAFGYDEYGRQQTRTDNASSVTYAYDDRDAPTESATRYGAVLADVSYAYYPDGSRSQMDTPAGSFLYAYDPAGKLTGLTNPLGETFAWTYLDNGWLWQQRAAASLLTTYTYNPGGQVTAIENRRFSDGALLSSFTGIAHDGAGNRTAFTSTLPGLPAYSGLTTFAYNNRDQLTQEQSARHGGTTFGFGYDLASNLTSFKGVGATYNANNQNTAHVHDGNGNPTLYKGATLGYDAENKLTSIGTSFTAGYTAEGLRAWKQSASGRTYFVYDGISPVCELDANGDVLAVSTFGAVGLASRHNATSQTSVCFAFDPQGSLSQRLDSSGSVLSAHSFDAYGVGTATAAPLEPVGYKGQWGYVTDVETGLLALGLRYYDPATGRFLTRDPIGYGAGPNLYAYCSGNPVTCADPSGTTPVHVGFALAWGVYEIGSALYDAYTAYQTFTDPCADTGEKLAAGGGLIASALLPGGGYGTAGRQAVNIAADLSPRVGIISSRMHTLDLTNSAWRRASYEQEGLIYVLKDAETGELLKVGQTTAGRIGRRFEPYVTAGRRNERKLAADVFETPLNQRGQVEGEVRRHLGNLFPLPWDNTGRRLGRRGSGLP